MGSSAKVIQTRITVLEMTCLAPSCPCVRQLRREAPPPYARRLSTNRGEGSLCDLGLVQGRLVALVGGVERLLVNAPGSELPRPNFTTSIGPARSRSLDNLISMMETLRASVTCTGGGRELWAGVARGEPGRRPCPNPPRAAHTSRTSVRHGRTPIGAEERIGLALMDEEFVCRPVVGNVNSTCLSEEWARR